MDLRVDDSVNPVDDLAKLLARRMRYQRAVRAFEQALDGDPAGAEQTFGDIHPGARTDPDQVLWRAVIAALAGHDRVAHRMLDDLRDYAPQFLTIAQGLVEAGLAPVDLLAGVMPAGTRGRESR